MNSISQSLRTREMLGPEGSRSLEVARYILSLNPIYSWMRFKFPPTGPGATGWTWVGRQPQASGER